MEVTINRTTLQLVQGDITEEATEAIVNAANSTLLGGGGVDGAIHRVGGPTILEECRTLGGCETGDAKITTGGELNAKFVIHTVGPVYRSGNEGEAELLASCYRRSLEVASENGIRSVSFPAISTGAYGYPVNEASRVALRAVIDYVHDRDDIELVRFVLFSSGDLKAYDEVFAELLSSSSEDN
jgi:O-acetyl-ADP-ribose deacetylase (regulator of RNase III)